jgi:4-alpha-glucanotransferase
MKRVSGILLHISSLPGKYGVGDLGPQAYKFADFLKSSGQRLWQVLPVNPPSSTFHPSPYTCLSAFGGNSLLISPELLYQDGLLSSREISEKAELPNDHVDYPSTASYKQKLLHKAFTRFQSRRSKPGYTKFCSENKWWLDDIALFVALRSHFGTGFWNQWPAKLRDREKACLKEIKLEMHEEISREKFVQYQFSKQWHALKNYCGSKGIKLIGDMPIYTAYDSTDVWAHRKFFKLTKTGKLKSVAGVPPDHFSKTGQLWGNPVYDWDALKKANYSWWFHRIKYNLSLFDIVRLDHFKGFVSYWEVPARYKTAEKGKWTKAGGEDFFEKLLKRFPARAFIVEDLGHITDEVETVIEKFNLAGMKILQYGFDGSAKENPHCPFNYDKNSVVYTGTHDNNTIRGWLDKEAKTKQKKRLFEYLGKKVHSNRLHWEMIRLAYASGSRLCIIPMQDILGLGHKARMNRPGTIKGNWQWRLQKGGLTAVSSRKLAKLTEIYGRS